MGLPPSVIRPNQIHIFFDFSSEASSSQTKALNRTKLCKHIQGHGPRQTTPPPIRWDHYLRPPEPVCILGRVTSARDVLSAQDFFQGYLAHLSSPLVDRDTGPGISRDLPALSVRSRHGIPSFCNTSHSNSCVFLFFFRGP